MELEQSFIALIEQSIKTNWYLNALTDYKGITLQYRDVARKIEKIHILLENAGIEKGDKIAICGRNSAHWTVTYLAVITYGAVVVPILHEFKADQVHNIVNHSESRLLFVGDQIWENLNEAAMPHLEGIIELKDFVFQHQGLPESPVRQRRNGGKLQTVRYPQRPRQCLPQQLFVFPDLHRRRPARR